MNDFDGEYSAYGYAEDNFAPVSFMGAGLYGNSSRESYDHEDTIKRWHDVCTGERRFFDEDANNQYLARVAAMEDENRENVSDSELTKGLVEDMSGVWKVAAGQTVEQMLEVRTVDRRLLRENKKKLGNLPPLTQPMERGAAYASFVREDAIPRFMKHIYNGPLKLQTKGFSNARNWYNTLSENMPRQFTVPPLYENLSTFGNMITGSMARMDACFKFGHMSRPAMVLRLSALSGMALHDNLKCNCVMGGKASSGKSFCIYAISKLMPPGTCRAHTYETARSAVVDEDEDQVVRLYEEMTAAQLGQEPPNKMDSATSSIYKNALTNAIVTTSSIDIGKDNGGRRLPIYSVSSQRCSRIGAYNEEIVNEDSPLVKRYIVISVDSIDAMAKTSIENKIFSIDVPELTERQEKMAHQMRLESYFYMLVELAIGSGTIRDVNLDPLKVYADKFCASMNHEGTPLSDSKRFDQVECAVRTVAILTAISHVFFSPDTEEWRCDASGQYLPLEKILPRALTEVEALLTCTMEQCVYVLTLFDMLWKDTDWELVCDAIRDSVLGNDMKKFIDLTREHAVNDLEAIHIGMRNGMSMQEVEMAKKVRSLQLRRNQELHTKNTHQVRKFEPIEPDMSMAALNIDNKQMINQAREAEANMENYINSAVPLPFLQLTTSSGRVIDPHYVKISRNALNLAGTAHGLREKMRERKAAVENIRRLIKGAQKEKVWSRFFVFDPLSSSLQLDGSLIGKRHAIPAVVCINGSSRSLARTENQTSRSNFYFIAIEYLIGKTSVADQFERVIRSMCFSVTPRQTLLTGISVRAPMIRLENQTIMNITFDNLFRTIDVGPNPDNVCKIFDTRVPTKSEARAINKLLGDNYTPRSEVRIYRAPIDSEHSIERARVIGMPVENCDIRIIDERHMAEYARSGDGRKFDIYPVELLAEQQLSNARYEGLSAEYHAGNRVKFDTQGANYCLAEPGESRNTFNRVSLDSAVTAAALIEHKITDSEAEARASLQKKSRKRAIDYFEARTTEISEQFKQPYSESQMNYMKEMINNKHVRATGGHENAKKIKLQPKKELREQPKRIAPKKEKVGLFAHVAPMPARTTQSFAEDISRESFFQTGPKRD